MTPRRTLHCCNDSYAAQSRCRQHKSRKKESSWLIITAPLSRNTAERWMFFLRLFTLVQRRTEDFLPAAFLFSSLCAREYGFFLQHLEQTEVYSRLADAQQWNEWTRSVLSHAELLILFYRFLSYNNYCVTSGGVYVTNTKSTKCLSDVFYKISQLYQWMNNYD